MSGDNTGGSGTDKGTGTDSKSDDKGTDKGTGGSTDDKVGSDPALKTDDVAGLKKALEAERKQRQTLEKAARDAELAKLPELERAQTEALTLKDENAKLTTENMRLKTGLKLGMPWSLAKRLTGDTEEEMQADASDLMKDYKGEHGKPLVKDDPKNKRPPNDAKKTGSVGTPGMNEILRALRKG